jgi:hypothetical protein
MELAPYIARIRDEKGVPWAISRGYGGTPRQMLASLIYHHFLETEEGQEMWASEGDDKVQDIYDRMYDRYVTDGFIPEEVWLEDADDNGMTIDNYLYEQIDAGVN